MHFRDVETRFVLNARRHHDEEEVPPGEPPGVAWTVLNARRHHDEKERAEAEDGVSGEDCVLNARRHHDEKEGVALDPVLVGVLPCLTPEGITTRKRTGIGWGRSHLSRSA